LAFLDVGKYPVGRVIILFAPKLMGKANSMVPREYFQEKIINNPGKIEIISWFWVVS
jgi:hypothetical protein